MSGMETSNGFKDLDFARMIHWGLCSFDHSSILFSNLPIVPVYALVIEKKLSGTLQARW